MGLLAKLRGRTSTSPESTPMETVCPHVALTPRWDSTEDMGHEDRVSGYRCDSCGQTFTPTEGRELQQTETARLKQTLET
jgi:hypothetical protein